MNLFTKLMIFTMVFSFGLAGCSLHSRPNVVVYPKENQSAIQVARDKGDCRAWAEEESGFSPTEETVKDAGVGAALGALGGAAAGAIIGGAVGSPGKGAAVGAAVGGVSGAGIGGTSGYVDNWEQYDRAYAVCMEARRYAVN